ncbi:putative molybdopterin-guanine dinucleotide biosynthesis protein A [Devosia sp. LC5]|uniref:nucleotidyltransferase family protein n=1 Tax=Devosia sp. LC5 TaxID=1502724 RepID=UPI0004E36602|nr:nucleotidyltransferase family protein [Devosia sp. LC5]KFC68237.1 putative molybdopterin-guanine dinucleotide biosynthesis protein A [Devosia sp. LC5]
MRMFDVIVLAAGSSRRFAHGNKLIQPYCGRPLICHVLSVIEQLDIGQPIIVTGEPYRDEIMSVVVTRPRWREAVNKRATEGIGTSIATGAALLNGTRGVFICPADMPLISQNDFQRTAELFVGPTSICRPMFEGRPGHPVLFGSAHYQRLRALEGDVGGASMLRHDPRLLATYASVNQGVVLDLDTAEQFTRAAMEDRFLTSVATREATSIGEN